MENIDETHFVVNMDNGRTLGFQSDMSTKYAELISGGDSITLVVRISGGRRSMIKAPMLILLTRTVAIRFEGSMTISPKCHIGQDPKAGWTRTCL